jgi:PPOX class probable F420-dependent enzyme
MTITSEKYVSITTYRKNGEPVATPVWIAPLPDGRAGFTTDADSGKAKRLRNDARVVLRPCSMRGEVRPDALEVKATATVVTGAAAAPVTVALRRKYKVMARVLAIGGSIRRLRGKPAATTAVIVTFD